MPSRNQNYSNIYSQDSSSQNPFNKLEPFNVSLYIVGYKLSNCVIDSRSSENVMPTQVAKALGLSYMSSLGKSFSVDDSLIPTLG